MVRSFMRNMVDSPIPAFLQTVSMSARPFILHLFPKLSPVWLQQTWEEGRINIDDSVGKYLTGFPLTGVTVRMLLNHRSGISARPLHGQYGVGPPQTDHQPGCAGFPHRERKQIPCGTSNRGFSYSNTNYALLALMIEKVTGIFYGDYLKQPFFDSIGMKDTYTALVAYANHYLPSYFNAVSSSVGLTLFTEIKISTPLP